MVGTELEQARRKHLEAETALAQARGNQAVAQTRFNGALEKLAALGIEESEIPAQKFRLESELTEVNQRIVALEKQLEELMRVGNTTL